jgi:hypothetical protein
MSLAEGGTKADPLKQVCVSIQNRVSDERRVSYEREEHDSVGARG